MDCFPLSQESGTNEPIKTSTPPRERSPIDDLRELPPKMTVNKDIVVYEAEDGNVSAAQVAFKWRITPLDLDKTPRQPFPASNANPADPRLKIRPQVPVLLNIPPVSTEEKESEVKTITQQERKRRPKLMLNERANTFARAGIRAQSKTAAIYSNILDPRLLKRQKIDREAAPTETVAEDEQSLTPKPLQVAFSP